MSVTPDLQAVYKKWENRGPSNRQTDSATQRILQDGRQKWKEKYGEKISRPRRTTSTRQKALPIENVSNNIITQFKTTPVIMADNLTTTRPIMGRCCSCTPYSQKDFNVTSHNLGIHNILDVTGGVRPKTFMEKRFKTVAYALGRNTSHRYKDVLKFVLASPRVLEAVQIQTDKATTTKRQEKIKKKPLEILNVMKAVIYNKLVKLTAYVLLKLLPVMLNGVHVHKNQMAVIKKASKRGIPMIYLPLHLSHLDYILVTFILWNYDIKAPYVAAGDNLNIPAFNVLLHGLGGFFIRRKLDRVAGQKDLIYRAVLHTYMQEILRSGEDLEFFIEGGRTRSGRAYHPKGGLLSVVIDTLNEGIIEDAYIVPISINYDRILDGNFCSEEMGLPKKRETFWGAINGIIKVLRGNYGSVRVDFSHPFSLKEYMQRSGLSQSVTDDDLPDTPSPIRSSGSSSSLYGTDVVIEDERQIIDDVAQHVLYNSVRSQALMCTNIIAFLLLTKYREGCSVKQLTSSVDWLKDELKSRRRDVGFVGETSEVIDFAIELLTDDLVKKSSTCDIQPCTEMPYIFELSYYANPVISAFLLESVIACSVIVNCNINLSSVNTMSEEVTATRDDILSTAQSVCKLLKYDFLFCPPCKRLEEELADALDELVTSEILKVQEDDTGYMDQQQKWARSLSATVSWDDDEDEGFSEQVLKVNTQRTDCRNKLSFYYTVLAPILESYYLTALHISRDLTVELPEDSFTTILHKHAKTRVDKNLASFSESAALTTIKNAIKGFKDLNVVNIYYAGNIRMIELRDHFQVWNKLNFYLDMLENLRN